MTDTTDWKAEAERLRADLSAANACAERYMSERNQARLAAQREVAERDAALAELEEWRFSNAVDVLRRERDRASSLFERIASKHARLAAWAREALPKELQAQFFGVLANGAPDWRTAPRNLAVDLLAATAERDAALAELERVQARGWPSTPEDVRALLGSRCGAVRYALPVLDGESEPPPDISDTYTVSAHDLITCNISASEMRYAADVELERVRAELAQAREVLRNVEWVASPFWDASISFCASCGNASDDGHAPDCALHAALTAKGE